jgi:nickel superoxide dismutase
MKNFFLPALLVLISFNNSAFSHCEVPCGIYEDSLRIELIKEHITTLEKSMTMINDLSAAGDKNYNQLIRWVNNKEIHASKIQDILTGYFLFQRIKAVPSDDEHYQLYLNKLMLIHELSVTAMKCKQSTDLKNITKMRTLLNIFSDSYFHKHNH